VRGWAQAFKALTLLYLDTYATRVSHVYVTLRHKLIALGHFWRFLAEQYPEITTSADVAPAHGRAYIPYAIARARECQRGEDTGAEAALSLARNVSGRRSVQRARAKHDGHAAASDHDDEQRKRG
jgi:hypothetical protein